MAFTIQGTEAKVFAGSNPAAQNITVPASCKCVGAFVTFYITNGATATTPTLGGTNMDVGRQLAQVGDAVGAYCFYRLNPASGLLALDPAFSGIPSEGPLYQILYVTADGDITFVDSDSDAREGGATASVTSTSNLGDLAIGHAQKFNAAPTHNGTDISSGSQVNASEHGQLFTVTAGASSSTLTGANDYSSVISLILRETGGGGGGATYGSRMSANTALASNTILGSG